MTFRHLFSFSLILFACATLMSCNQNVTTSSIVSEDGSIERVIAFSGVDSSRAETNIFGIRNANGWSVEVKELPQEEPGSRSQKKYDIRFAKKFASVNEANTEMNPADKADIFKIESRLDKRFRWFYTYYDYSDTYKSLNRFKLLKHDDYFTPEDYAFINRLPAEGKPINRADELFLEKLSERIYDHYAVRAIYEENFDLLTKVLREFNVAQNWIDTLHKEKEPFLEETLKKSKEEKALDMDEDFVLELLDRIQPSIDKEAITARFRELSSDLEKRMDFMSSATQGPYSHVIQVPWNVVATNADSVSGNSVVWNPPVTKFLLSDYTMSVEGRQLNLWAVIVTLVLIGITIYLFGRKRAVA